MVELVVTTQEVTALMISRILAVPVFAFVMYALLMIAFAPKL